MTTLVWMFAIMTFVIGYYTGSKITGWRLKRKLKKNEKI